MKAGEPLVSVFMPTYNHQEFIGAAIDSVFAQDYGNLELVIGDDGSKDGTWAVVQDYRSRFPDVIKAVRHEHNLGITGNCNEILKRCTGKYIAFHSGDDLLLPGKIRKQVDLMEGDPSVVLCYHDVEVFLSNTAEIVRHFNHGPSSANPVAGPAETVVKAVVAKGTAFMAALSVMVRRDAVPASGFDARIPIASDWMMWIEILAKAKPDSKVAFLNEVLARYRRHDSNVSDTGYAYYSDVLTTLALVESEYPWLSGEVVSRQAELRYLRGIRLICDGEFALGRAHLIQSAGAKRRSFKWFGWFAASYFPALRPKSRI